MATNWIHYKTNACSNKNYSYMFDLTGSVDVPILSRRESNGTDRSFKNVDFQTKTNLCFDSCDRATLITFPATKNSRLFCTRPICQHMIRIGIKLSSGTLSRELCMHATIGRNHFGA